MGVGFYRGFEDASSWDGSKSLRKLSSGGGDYEDSGGVQGREVSFRKVRSRREGVVQGQMKRQFSLLKKKKKSNAESHRRTIWNHPLDVSLEGFRRTAGDYRGLYFKHILVHVCVLSQVRHFGTPWTVSLQGSSVLDIFQARIPELVTISYSRGSSWPRDWTCVSCVSWIGRHILYHCATWEASYIGLIMYKYLPNFLSTVVCSKWEVILKQAFQIPLVI